MARHTRVRALPIGVAALLLFQAVYTLPRAAAADPSASPGSSASIEPSLAPEGTTTATPLVAPEVTPGSIPSVTVAPTEQEPSAAPSATQAPSPTPTPSAPPIDQDTGLKPGATEVVAARTESSQTYDNHDGTFTSVFASAPEFYQPVGSTSWEPITIGLEAGTKSDPLVGARPVVISDRAPASVSLFDLTSKDFVTVASKGKSVGFALPLNLAKTTKPTAPVVNGIAVDYVDMLPGVDLRVIARALGSKAFVILHGIPADPTWTFRVDAPGLTLVAQDDGSISLVDGSGAAIGSIPHPYALDSTADPLSGDGRYTDRASVAIGRDADGAPTITISVDPEWLATAVYPVYVDPSFDFHSTNNTADAHTASAYPTTNFGAYQMPTSPNYYEMWLGLDPSGTSGTSHDYVRWDVSSLGGVTVDGAQVSTHPWHQYYNAPTVIRSWIARLTSSFVESTITYNNAPSGGNDLAFIDGVEGQTSWSNPTSGFTGLVQDWIDGTNPTSGANYGVRIWEDGNGSTYWKRILASEDSTNTAYRPTLRVTYHTPVSTVYPTGGGPTSDTTLTWMADSSWATGAGYHVDVATDAGFSSIVWTSGDVAPSAVDSAAIGATLALGTTYYWRVKVKNSAAVWTPFSATASFVYDLGNLGGQSQFGLESFDLGGGDQASVNVSTGNLILTHPIVRLPIRGGSTSIVLTYNSQDRVVPSPVDIAPGWRLNVHRRLTLNGDNTVTFTDADDARYTFTNPQTVGTVTTYTRPAALLATLKKDTGQTVEFTLTYRDQSRDTFDISGANGLLTRSEDRHANGVTIGYVAGTTRVNTITDTAGSRTIDVAYDGSNRVSSITDWAWVSGGVVQTTASGARRVTRFFYDGSGNLAGWADPLNTSGSCPTGGTHVTCITYGATLSIAKTQTVEAAGATSLTTSTRPVTTQVAMVGAEANAVRDAVQADPAVNGPYSTFTRGASQTVVVRPGTPSSTTTYGYLAATDSYARILSVWRLLNSTNIERRNAYGDAGFPTLPTTVTDNYGALLSTPAHSSTTTYVANSLGLVSRTVEPLTASPATNRWTDFTYNTNNDVTQKIVSQDGSGTLTTTTRLCYDASCTLSGSGLDLLKEIDNYTDGTAGNGLANEQDVTTTHQYDAYGQRTRETRANYKADGTLLDMRATGYSFDNLGNQTSQVTNYVDGAVTNPGDDITPNVSTNARTDLTTTYAFDTAGNQVSVADPRRPIEIAKGTSLGADDFIGRATFDPLGSELTTTLPTTPGAGSCSPDPTCRRSISTYDELGNAREAVDAGGRYSGTILDSAGRSLQTLEDTDGIGAGVPTITGKAGFDAAGRMLWAEDQAQANDPAGGSDPGRTETTYDTLGRSTTTTEAAGSTGPDLHSDATTSYDALNRQLTQTIGANNVATAKTTTYAFDLGGRTIQTDDEFTCTTTAYDYRDFESTRIEGRTPSTCSGSGSRTIGATYDSLGRITLSAVTAGTGVGDKLAETVYDGAGNALSTSSYLAATSTTLTTTYKYNPLDQTIEENRLSAGGSFAKTNFDAAGNPTDACVWASAPADPCKVAGSTFSNPQPIKTTTTGYDARNYRISFSDPATGTTAYDPSANYQISYLYVPTSGTKERQSHYQYDGRNRLSSITDVVCAVGEHPCSAPNTLSTTLTDSYAYDGNDNLTSVIEANGSTTTTRYLCYDARNQLIGVNDTNSCTSGLDETFAYDASGNRTSATGRTFTYNSASQLASCTSPSCSVAYNADGQTQTLTDNAVTWSFLYDGEGRLTSACKSSSCAGSGFDRVDSQYDGEGHRTQLKVTTAAGAVTTTAFRYQGDAVAQESENGVVARTFVVDESGRIARMCVPDCTGSNPVYLVTWNGHGDAAGLWKQNSDGTLSLANSFTYSTWGTPTTAVAGGFSDLNFRYLYVGAFDVQWDNSFGLGLLYMHARHYSPALGRFLQPDPSRMEDVTYTYAENNPITKTDPYGQCGPLCIAIVVGFLVSGLVSAGAYVVSENAAHHPIEPDQLAISFFVGGAAGAWCVYAKSVASCGRVSAAASILMYHLSHGPKSPEGYILAGALGWLIRKWVHTPYVPNTSYLPRSLGVWILYLYPGMSKVATAFRALMTYSGINWLLYMLNNIRWYDDYYDD